MYLDVPLPGLIKGVVQTPEHVIIVNPWRGLKGRSVEANSLSPDAHDIQVVGYCSVQVAPHKLQNTVSLSRQL